MPNQFSAAYLQVLQRGAFPNQIDPFAEAGRYFQQIHSGMIHWLQDQLQDDLNLRGYQVGKEASLQIVANRQPDLYIQQSQATPSDELLNYELVATALQLDAGTAVQEDGIELDALHIVTMDTSELVTVVEIISPRNKTHNSDIASYRDERHRLFLAQGINVVEIDATRSIKRLIQHDLVRNAPYHIAIHLPHQLPRVLINNWDETLKPFALPLRGDGIKAEPHIAYEKAYRRGAIAGLIEREGRYSADHLPFPSTLTETQKQQASDAINQWREERNQLAEA